MAEYTIKARPTTYKGVQMRSRLEANFAQLLDRWGVEWEYEPRCYADETGQYLPDFETSGWSLPATDTYPGGRLKDSLFIETKPINMALDDTDEFEDRMLIIRSTIPNAGLALWFPEDWWMCLAIPGRRWGMGRFYLCAECHRPFIWDEFGGWPIWCPSHKSAGLLNVSALGEHHTANRVLMEGI